MKRCLAFMLLLMMMCSCVSKSKYDTAQDRIEELEDTVSSLEDRNQELEELVETLEDIIERAKYQCRLWDDDALMALRVLNEY